MQLEFVKVNPVENMTVFILDEVEKSQHIEIAKKLMAWSFQYSACRVFEDYSGLVSCLSLHKETGGDKGL